MKKLLLLPLLCIFALACTHTEKDVFIIKGDVKGVKDGTVVHLYEQIRTFWAGKEADTVRNGKFSFRIPLTENARFSVAISVDDPEFPLMTRDIWAVPGEKATIKGDNNIVYSWKIKSNVPAQAEVNRYLQTSQKEYEELAQVLISEKKTLRNMENAQQETMDSLGQLRDSFKMIINRNNIAIMDETPVSEVWIDKLRALSSFVAGQFDEQFQPLREDAERLYKKLSDEEKESAVGKNIRKALDYVPQVYDEIETVTE